MKDKGNKEKGEEGSEIRSGPFHDLVDSFDNKHWLGNL